MPSAIIVMVKIFGALRSGNTKMEDGKMNRTVLKDAEGRFLIDYPAGFSDPFMLEIAKKHKIEKMNNLAQESFAKKQFKSPNKIVESMAKVVSQSSLVSIFEKIKFRDLAKALSADEKECLSHGLREFLHGDQGFGFELMRDLLNEYKLAKWTLLTICPVYYRPDLEVYIQPTTTKKIIAYYQLEGLKYSPKPTYEFYQAYREQINQMKAEVEISLQGGNAAFSGFLMMSLRSL